MPRWTPEAKWVGQEVFVIGGGNSLKDFDWNLLKDELTVGCNDAFLLGHEICKICVFGDKRWFRKHEKVLADYGNKAAVFTNYDAFHHTKIPWLWYLRRELKGLHTDALGWNRNTGSSALNLALLLGASVIYLLGFDMHLSPNREANWHSNNVDKPNPAVYKLFLKDFEVVKKDWLEKFPDRKIINVTDDSDLEIFPKVGVKEFWSKRKETALCLAAS